MHFCIERGKPTRYTTPVPKPKKEMVYNTKERELTPGERKEIWQGNVSNLAAIQEKWQERQPWGQSTSGAIGFTITSLIDRVDRYIEDRWTHNEKSHDTEHPVMAFEFGRNLPANERHMFEDIIRTRVGKWSGTAVEDGKNANGNHTIIYRFPLPRNK